MTTGVVKKFFGDKGYGFIVPDQAGDDIFVHVRDCIDATELKAGQRLSFDLSAGRDGRFKAVNVRRVPWAG